jgi:hypothetical protein
MHLNKKGGYFVIPVSVIQYVLTEKIVRTFQVYVALKSISPSGTIIINTAVKNEIATKLNVTVRTIELELRKLVQLNWLGKSENRYYPRSFSFFKNFDYHKSSIGVIFEPNDIKTFKSFLIGAVIGHWLLIQLLKKRKETKGRLEFHNRGNASTKRPSLSYFPFSNSILSLLLECSMSTASIYKNEAFKHNYIDVKRQYISYPVQLHELGRLKGALLEDNAKRVRVNNSKVVERATDSVATLMRFRKRKK